MNVAATQLALLCLINPDSFDEIIRQRGEILVTVSEFMTVLPLANVTQLQNSELDWVSETNIIPDLSSSQTDS